MLDPKSLKRYADVLECGTISAAAKREHIASAATSRRIAALGIKLVSQSNKGMIPTAAGRSLLDMSRRVLDDLAAVRVRMEEYAHGLNRCLGNSAVKARFTTQPLD